MDLADIYRTFHPNIKEYTFFSAPHGTFSKIDHIIENKASFNRYKRIKITPYVLSDHPQIKAGYPQQQKACKFMDIEELSTK